MTKRKSLWDLGDIEKHDWWNPQYIETPLKLFHGNNDKVIYPHILVVVIIGAFLGALFLT